MPAQSYLAQVSNSVTVCTTETALAKYSELQAKFNGGNIAGDPWSHVDHFGRTGFHKVLTSVYNSLGKASGPIGRSGVLLSSSSDERQCLRSSGKHNKKVYFGKRGTTEGSKTVEEPQKGSSK